MLQTHAIEEILDISAKKPVVNQVRIDNLNLSLECSAV